MNRSGIIVVEEILQSVIDSPGTRYVTLIHIYLQCDSENSKALCAPYQPYIKTINKLQLMVCDRLLMIQYLREKLGEIVWSTRECVVISKSFEVGYDPTFDQIINIISRANRKHMQKLENDKLIADLQNRVSALEDILFKKNNIEYYNNK